MHAAHKELFRAGSSSGKARSFENDKGVWHAMVEVIDFDPRTNTGTAWAYAYGGPADEAPSNVVPIVEDVSYGEAWEAALAYAEEHGTDAY